MFGRKRRKSNSSSKHLSREVTESVAQLQQLAEERPELTSPAELYAELLPKLFDVDGTHQPIIIDPEPAAKQLAFGVPLFRATHPDLNARVIRESWQKACAVLERHRDAKQPRDLADAVSQGKVEPTTALRGLFDHGLSQLQAQLRSIGLDEMLGITVLRLCALPLLQQLTGSLESLVSRSRWSHGYCPVCGSVPLLAEMRGLDQTRWLRCGLCATGWQIDRIFCPFCAGRDHKQLQVFYVEGEEQKRWIAACDACGSYVKSRATLTPLKACELLVAEVELFHLDLVAKQRGYSPPQ